MSSPNLNNLILLGAIFIYGSIFISGLDSTLVSDDVEVIACQVRDQPIVLPCYGKKGHTVRVNPGVCALPKLF